MDVLMRAYRRRLDAVDSRIHRFLFEDIDWTQPLIGIKGQRGVGKTTLMLQRIKKADPTGAKSFYVSLDNLWFADHSLIDLAEEILKSGIKHLYLDEVHRMPGWERQIKNLYDSYPELHVVFTGSSLLEIDYSIGDLSRRVSMHTLPGLSFREYLMFEGHEVRERLSLQDVLYAHETIAPSVSSSLKVLPLFRRYLERGYYPFYKSMKRDDYYNRLEQTVSTVIESDIPAVENKIDYETLIKAKRLVSIISGSLPYIPNMSTLAGVMGSTRSHILKLFDLLERAGIIRQLFMGVNGSKSLAKPQKILLDNASLMYAFETPQIGAARESAFASFLSVSHRVNFAKQGDFVVDGRYLFEVEGKGKGFAQIRNIPDSFVVADDIEFGLGNKIPLWLFGFLY
ncbi:MAG: AAA family ATPase [Bacteroides sp.]|nr:AAA family ATPase [Ruminococcus flavefaciens]MCM1555167.1 AAA family ATPase [Bacteroides sp.]